MIVGLPQAFIAQIHIVSTPQLQAEIKQWSLEFLRAEDPSCRTVKEDTPEAALYTYNRNQYVRHLYSLWSSQVHCS